MLIQPDKNELGDLRLDVKEGAAKAHEDNKRMASVYKIPDQKLLEDREMAEGNFMDWKELVRRIHTLSPKIFIEKGGYPNALAVRIERKNWEGKSEKEYITGFLMEKLPEYSSVLVDKNDLPKREVRGWRTVLQALIRAGALTQKQCDLTFGPALGQRAVLWDRAKQARS
jgi:hypothetical protein